MLSNSMPLELAYLSDLYATSHEFDADCGQRMDLERAHLLSDAIKSGFLPNACLAAPRLWRDGAFAAAAWAAAAVITVGVPDIIPWGSTELFAAILAAGGLLLLLTAFLADRLGGVGQTLRFHGPRLIALGLIFAVWETVTAKLGWLPKPFFAPPQGLLHAYVVDGHRLLLCVLYSLRLWAIGFSGGVITGFLIGVPLGWSTRFAYWGMPLLKLIGPVPATAWTPITFFILPTTFAASCFLVGIASGIPVTILTAAGVAATNRAYYDVARNVGASDWFLMRKVAVPAALPHVFVGLFMALYYSFAVLVVAEMLGARYGLGWYIAFQTGYSAYANVYAAIVIMALICSGIVKLLFVGRGRLLSWQAGIL